MSIPDRLMPNFWRLAADLDPAALATELGTIERAEENPMVAKKRLAVRIVTLYHGPAAAEQARDDFEAQFSRREAPDRLETFGRDAVKQLAGDGLSPRVVEVVMAAGLAGSKGAARRLVEQGAVSLDGERVSSIEVIPDLSRPFILRVGRRMKRFQP